MISWRRRAQALRFLGWPGAVAVTLLAANLAFYFSMTVPARDEVERLRISAEYAQAKKQRVARNQLATPPTPASDLERFNAFFPPAHEAPKWIATVYAAARGEKLVLERGDYKGLRDVGVPLVRYQITLPVKGTYPQIRRFVAEILEEIPSASIDDISIKRDKIGSEAVDARIKISLYMRDGRNAAVADGT